MIERICPKCRVPMNGDKCIKPNCGCATKMSSTIYWCDDCNVPIFENICPSCGNKGRYIATDMRPVFPEENVLISLILGDNPQKYQESSVWFGSGMYIIDGKKVRLSITKLNSLPLDKIHKLKEKYEAFVTKINYCFFDEYIRKFIKANADRYNFITEEAVQFVQKYREKYAIEDMMVSFSGGKDSTVTSHIVNRALGTNKVLHIFGDTTLEFPYTLEYKKRFKKNEESRGVRVLTAKNREKNFEDLCDIVGPPSRVMRWCCTVFKTGAIQKTISSAFKDKNNILSLAELKTDLKQYSQKTLILFKEIYPKVTAGSEFNPMALADALPLYKSVSEKLVDEYGYSGIYIVFDEFSKFIEGQNNIAAGTNMHLLQSMCELATDSKNAQVFITMVAHKSIKEYGKYLSRDLINLFTGIEGRIIEKYFVTSSKNNYELIKNAIVKDDSKELSKKFNDKGWRTLVLSGSDSEEARAAAIERLAGEESEDALDYIISVDIFSEGVDVPEINQVIMLRPTESPIVFIQQLGRGLRKAENKEYVVVLDFIGNYRNNFMIPIALSGDRSYNKDNIRRYVTEGGRVIPGASTIHFDEISRKRIFQAIDNANFSDIKLIRENYTNLKNKLGHIPALADFDKYGEMDVLRIFDNNSLGSYYKFLVKYEKEYTIRLSEDEEKAIEFISKKLASGKRIHELELLKRTLQYHHGIIGRLRKHLSEKYQCEMDEHCTENVVNMMTNEFSMSAAKKTYAQCVFLKKEQDDYGISDVYGKMLQNPEFCAILEELVDFGISRYKVNYSYHYQDTNLVLYQKYTYEDACRLLNWERNEVPLNIGGYKYDKKTKTFPIFINYDKQDNISDTTKYEDHFVAENRLIAISKSGRSMDSEDVQNFLKATERGIDVQLFVRKNKDDKISKEFYYLGRVIATGNAKQFVIPNTDKTAVEIEWELETPVREDIYQYIVNE